MKIALTALLLTIGSPAVALVCEDASESTTVSVGYDRVADLPTLEQMVFGVNGDHGDYIDPNENRLLEYDIMGVCINDPTWIVYFKMERNRGDEQSNWSTVMVLRDDFAGSFHVDGQIDFTGWPGGMIRLEDNRVVLTHANYESDPGNPEYPSNILWTIEGLNYVEHTEDDVGFWKQGN